MLTGQITSAILGVAIAGAILFLVRRDHLHGPYALWWLGVAAATFVLGVFPKVVAWLGRETGIVYAPVLPIIRGHHERWDGSGYPDGLRGESIPLLARILQLVDIYDALTTKRSYKEALAHEEAIRMLEEEVARGWRDPELLPLFAETAKSFANETLVADDVVAMQQSLANMSAHLR